MADAPSPLTIAGILIVLGALLTIAGIGSFFASGAVPDEPGSAASAGKAFAEATGLLELSAYLSVAGNVLLITGALMLAHAGGHARMDGAARRVHLPGVWATLAFGSLLILPFDLALPRALIPLAQADPDSAVFAAMHGAVDLTHSVGLLVFYAATTALFVHQAHTAVRKARVGWRVAAGVSVVAMAVAVGLVVGRPPLPLVPAVFLTWLGVLWLGLRMARDGLRAAPDTRTHGVPVE